MTPYWQDPHLTLYGGDCRAVLAELPAESVHCVVTSPPYWGLRDYGTATWEGGDEACDHLRPVQPRNDRPKGEFHGGSDDGDYAREPNYRETCRKCGARRIDSQLGLEPTPEEYVADMVAVFREVKRVLRSDGTLWLNLGDSYNAYNGNAGPSSAIDQSRSEQRPRLESGHGLRTKGLKPKDLVGIPWRVAFALQADGWYLRSDIIWAKPNPMPESVTDRPTKAHEYLFLLTKSARYYYDADAVREAHETADRPGPRRSYPSGMASSHSLDGGHVEMAGPFTGLPLNPAGRNLRSVWSIATEPYPGAHFATFPRKLVEPCVKAGTSEKGVCPECGAPWRRKLAVSPLAADRVRGVGGRSDGFTRMPGGASEWRDHLDPETIGWEPTCKYDRCQSGSGELSRRAPLAPVPAVVLDPFAGSGTTLLVAQSLGRRGIGIDLNPDYLAQALDRNRQVPLDLGA